MKQNWGIPAYHECRYIPEVLEMFRSLKNIKTIKDLKKSGIPALRFLQAHLKSLESYKFGGTKLEHSPARFRTQIIKGIPTVTRESQPTLRNIIYFLHQYSDFILKLIPNILVETTHP